jgi:hypothetical protein
MQPYEQICRANCPIPPELFLINFSKELGHFSSQKKHTHNLKHMPNNTTIWWLGGVDNCTILSQNLLAPKPISMGSNFKGA